MGISVIPDLLKKRISKLITTNRRMGINNSTTRKKIKNSKTNYKQHERQKYNQLKIANIIKTEQIAMQLNDINTEQGTTTWLTTLPIEDEG